MIRMKDYIRMEAKSTLMQIPAFLRSFLLALVFIILGIVCICQVLISNQVFEKVKIGVVMADDDPISNYALSFVGSMKSVSGISEFIHMDEARAREEINNGKLSMAIIFPANLYDNVNSGENVPAEILYSDDAMALSMNKSFMELINAGVSLIKTGQSAVYGVSDVSAEHRLAMSQRNMETYISYFYLDCALKRNTVYEENAILPIGDYSLTQYYLGVILLIGAGFLGCSFAGMYERQDETVRKCMKRGGISLWKQSMVRLGILTMVTYIFLMLMLAACLGMVKTGYIDLPVHYDTFMGVGIVLSALSVASFIHLFYLIFQRLDQKLVLYLLAWMGMVIMAGGLVPAVYLPETVKNIGMLMPFKHWLSYLLQVLYYGADGKSMITELVFTIVLSGMGTVFMYIWDREGSLG